MNMIGKIIKKIMGFYYKSNGIRLLAFYRTGGGENR